MKKSLSLLGAVLASTALHTHALAADVGVSINIAQPGFYGRIDLGNAPAPMVIYPQPMVIQPMPMPMRPIYLRVPPGHERNWAKHCGRYNACNQPVYFVQENWYREVYAPSYQRQPEYQGHPGRGEGRHDHGRHGRFERERGDR